MSSTLHQNTQRRKTHELFWMAVTRDCTHHRPDCLRRPAEPEHCSRLGQIEHYHRVLPSYDGRACQHHSRAGWQPLVHGIQGEQDRAHQRTVVCEGKLGSGAQDRRTPYWPASPARQPPNHLCFLTLSYCYSSSRLLIVELLRTKAGAWTI